MSPIGALETFYQKMSKLRDLVISQISTSIIMLTCGTAYMFSLYGPQLSLELNYSSLETAFMAASANAGVYLGGPLVGYFVDRYPFKTRWILLLGGSLILIGYYSIGFMLETKFRLHYLLTSVIFFFIGLGR